MLVIFGLSRRERQIGAAVVTCGSCGRHGPNPLVRRRTRFSLFFVPVLPLGTRFEVRCPWCGSTRRVSRDEARRLDAAAA